MKNKNLLRFIFILACGALPFVIIWTGANIWIALGLGLLVGFAGSRAIVQG
jgi:Flp pilus assembly protein TadB